LSVPAVILNLYVKSVRCLFSYRISYEIVNKRNGIHPDVFKDKIQGLHQSNTSYLF